MRKQVVKVRILLLMKKYKAKVDLALFIQVVGIMLGATLLTVILPMKEPDPTAKLTGFGFALLMLGSTALCIQLFLATYYVIDRSMLTINTGFLYKRKKIPVASIRKIEKTRTLVSAPAPSFDRLEIFYNRFDSVVISPKDKPGFIANLIKLNPEIEVV